MQRIPIALLLLACSAANAQSITIQNPGFEDATLPLNGDFGPYSQLIPNSAIGNYSLSGTLANWSASSTTRDAGAGALAPAIGRSSSWTTKWWTGNNVAWVQTVGAGTASLSQTLTAQLEDDTVYTLAAVVGRAILAASGGVAIEFSYSIQLWAGSTMLASASNLALAYNSSGMDSLTYSSGPNNPQAGQPLTIVLSTSGGSGVITEAFFDNIALSATIPAVTVGAVISAGAFGGFTSVAPGSWIEIYGSNLASDTRSWTGADFKGIDAPTMLDGTLVTIGGQSAFIDYISPSQVNALVPSNVGTGTQQVTVTTPSGVSSPFTVTVNATEPGLLAPSSFNLNGTQYVVALFTDGTYALPAGAIAGVNSHPAKPGDLIVLYGVGFGPVTPTIPAGQVVGQSNTISSGLQISIGGQMASVPYDGFAFNYTGLYQLNVTVPQAGPGSVPLTFSLGGVAGAQTLYLAIGN